MPSSSIRVPLILSTVFCAVLTACGGGGGDGSTPPTTETPGGNTSPSSCLPTKDAFDKLAMGIDYAAAKATLGCEGQLASEAAAGGVQERTYAWGKVDSGAYAQVKFRNGALSARTGQRLSGRTTASECKPTASRLAQLSDGMSYDAARTAVGCEGRLMQESVIDGVTSNVYDWGDVATGPYLQTTFTAGALSGRVQQRIDGNGAPSACLPTQAHVDALAVGMSYADAVGKMGCEGQLLNEVTVDNAVQKTYAWGNVASGPYAQVVFRNGALSDRSTQRLDGSPETSSCLPTGAQFDAITFAMGYAAVRQVIGCEGHLQSDILAGNSRQTIYDWGSVVSGPYVQVNFTNDVVSVRLSKQLNGTGAPSTCTATQATYEALQNGMSPAAAESVIGCPGELESVVVAPGVVDHHFVWGSAMSGPYIRVSFTNGALSGKAGLRLN